MLSKNKKNSPTESELEILQILWEAGPNSVRFVNEKLNEKREVNKKPRTAYWIVLYRRPTEVLLCA